MREVAGDRLLLAAAFDGSIRAGFDLIDKYRAAECMPSRRLGAKVGKPAQSNVQVGILLNKAANRYAQIVRTQCRVSAAAHFGRIDDFAIMEAFPSAFQGLMLEAPGLIKRRRGNRSRKYFAFLAVFGKLEGLVEFLLPGRRLGAGIDTITNHGDRAASVCAVTALCVVADKYSAVGDEDGWVTLPPREFIEPWE